MRTLAMVNPMLGLALLLGLLPGQSPAAPSDAASSAPGGNPSADEGAQNDTGADIDFAVPLALATREVRIAPMAVAQATVVPRPGETPRETDLVMLVTVYDGTILRVHGNQVWEQQGQLARYELTPVERETPYRWAMWSQVPLWQFSIISSGIGRSYLAWVDGLDIAFAEVSQPREACVAFNECLRANGPPGIVTVPVSRFVDRHNLLGTFATYAEVNVRSISSPVEGQWRVELTGLDPAKVFTFVFDGSEWSLE